MTSQPGPQVAFPQPAPPRGRLFICCSGDDLQFADQVCRLLELEGIPCWIAPRNVNPRRDYGAQIIEAIELAPAMVLILSANANTSIFVPNEVERAVSKSKPVVVLRTEQVTPSRALELFVSRSQWIDGWTPPVEDRVRVLAAALRSLLGVPAVPGVMRRPEPRRASRRRPIWLGLAGLGFAAVAVVALVGGLLLTSRGAQAAASPSLQTEYAPSPTAVLSPEATALKPGFYPTDNMDVAHSGQTATLLPGGRVLIVGGQTASAELYVGTTGEFSPAGTMASARSFHTATLLPGGRVLIAGGIVDGVASATAELYDPATGIFTATGSMSIARENHTATLLPGGQVLIVGGTNDGGNTATATAEVFDLASGKFTSTGPMQDARENHTATLLTGGKVLIVGGDDGSYVFRSTELYDPETHAFAPAASMTEVRRLHTATPLSNGKVLIAGGWAGSDLLNSAELYDPETESFGPTGPMSTGRYAHTATALSDGRVLFAGGCDETKAALDSAELYDPKTGVFTKAASMLTARGNHTATLLGNQVLVAGGQGGNGRLASAELYQP